MKVPHPIQYQGSKRILAKKILRYLPRQCVRLVEPFAGTAALSIACAINKQASYFWVNDLNKPLAELFELIINHPTEIADFYEQIWKQQHTDSIEHYYRIREDFNRTKNPRLFLYLLARCTKGSVRYNTEGFFNQSPDKRRKGTRPETMRVNIFGVSNLLKGKSIISSVDYKDVLANIKSDDVVYMDPPYQGVCGEKNLRYFSGISYTEFITVLADLNVRRIRYAVSYDGRTGNKNFGNRLPTNLELTLIELPAGRSSQATLLGRDALTFESLYLSKNLVSDLKNTDFYYKKIKQEQIMLMETEESYGSSIFRRIS